MHDNIASYLDVSRLYAGLVKTALKLRIPAAQSLLLTLIDLTDQITTESVD